MNTTTTTTATATATDDAARAAKIAARAIMALMDTLGNDEAARALITDYFHGDDSAVATIGDTMTAIIEAREAKAAARAAKMQGGIDIPNPLGVNTIKVFFNLQFAADPYTLESAAEWADKPSEKAPDAACLAWLQYTGDKLTPWKIASVDDMVEAMTAKGVDEAAARKHAATVRNGIAARIRRRMASREVNMCSHREVKNVLIGARVSAKGGAEFARFTSYGRAAK